MSCDIVSIADPSDVTLVVGHSDNIVQLKVSSHILRAASKTFKIMFGPDFEEGQNLTYDNSKKVSLDDDDADAMEIVCNFLHFKHYDVPKEVDTVKVFKIAQIIDKYFLHEALKFLIELWMRSEKVTGFVGLGNMLKAATLLKHRTAFKRITKGLIMNCNEPFEALVDDTFPVLSENLIYTLERERSRLKEIFNQAIFEFVTASFAIHGCLCNIRYIQQLLDSFCAFECQPKDVAAQTISCSMGQVKNMARYADDGMGNCDKKPYPQHIAPGKLQVDLLVKLRPIRDYEGVILDDD